MAYEKLSVVYQYRDDPDCEESDDETANSDWWKDENRLQKENKSNKKSVTSKTQTHSYGKVAVNGSPEKPSSVKSNRISDEDTETPERKSVSERLKGALSSASNGLGNWLLASTRNSVPVDTFMCGGNAGLTSDNLERTLYDVYPSGVTKPRNY